MKKIILTLICLVVGTGCGPMTNEQRSAWSEAFKNISQMQHEQNLAQWQYSQPRIIYPNNSTYWQEQNAQKEYWGR